MARPVKTTQRATSWCPRCSPMASSRGQQFGSLSRAREASQVGQASAYQVLVMKEHIRGNDCSPVECTEAIATARDWWPSPNFPGSEPD
jgi:hypothetical protein